MNIPEEMKTAMRMIGTSGILNDLARFGEREVLTQIEGLVFIQQVLELLNVDYSVEELSADPNSTLPDSYVNYRITMKNSLLAK